MCVVDFRSFYYFAGSCECRVAEFDLSETMKVVGKVALITGGAEGLGKGFAEALLKKAAKGIGIADVNVVKGKETEQELNGRYGEGKVIFLKCDVTSSDQLQDAFKKTKEHYHQLDMVVNNAGIGDESNWQTMIDINLKAVVNGSYLAKQYMSRENTGGNGGLLINISSMAGLVGQPYGPVYTATKQAVIGFTRNLLQYDKAFTADDIRCNVLCPSFTDTAILTKSKLLSGSDEDPMIKAFRDTIKPLPVSKTVSGFMTLVEEDEHHGKVMRVTHEKGIDFQKFGSRYVSKI